MKRGFIILLLVLILIPSVLAATSVYDGRLYDNEPKVIDNITLRVSTGISKSAVTYGTHKFILYKGKCANDEYYEACLRDSEEGLFSDFSLIPKGLDISFSKTRNPTGQLAVLDPITVKLEVKNAGDFSLDFSVIDDASDLEITTIDSLCYVDGNNVVFNYTVRGTDTVSCTYRARVKTEGSLDKTAVMTFFDGKQIQSLEDSISMDVEKYDFGIDLVTDQSVYDVNNLVQATLKISNTFKESITIESLEVISSGLAIITNNPKFSLNRQSMSLSNVVMATGTSTDYLFKFNATKINNEVIINYKVLTPVGYRTNTIKRIISVAKIKPDITIQRISDTKLKVHVQNTNSRRPIKNLKLNLKSNYQNINLERTFSDIPASGDVIVDILLQPFDSRPATTYPLFASSTYETESGEGFSFSKTMQIDLRKQLTQQEEQEAANAPKETAQSSTEQNLTSKSSFSLSNFFKGLFSVFSKKTTNGTTEVVESANKSSTPITSKSNFLKPTKQKLIIIGSIIGIILLVYLVFFITKRRKSLHQIDVKLKDVKL